jgi:hypothetical protein
MTTKQKVGEESFEDILRLARINTFIILLFNLKSGFSLF